MVPARSPYSDDSEGPILREFVNNTMADDETPSPRTELLSPTSNGASPVDRRRRPRRTTNERSRRERELIHSGASPKDLLRLLVDAEHETAKLRKGLQTVFDRLDAETRRAVEAEQVALDTTQRFRALNEARLTAQQDAFRASATVEMYKLQMSLAQKEMTRAQEMLKQVEAQRDAAVSSAARARDAARRLTQERAVDVAREEGRRLGYAAGYRRAQQTFQNARLELREGDPGDQLMEMYDQDLYPQDLYPPDQSPYREQDIYRDENPRAESNRSDSPGDLPLRQLEDPTLNFPVTQPPPEPVPIVEPVPMPTGDPPPITRTPSVSLYDIEIPPADEVERNYNTNPATTNRRKISLRRNKTQPTQKERPPPDNFIPASSDGYIPIPPPFGFHPPPPASPHTPTVPLPPLPSGPFAGGGAQPRRASLESGSTHMSQLTLVTPPNEDALPGAVTRAMRGLSAIPEDVSRRASPSVDWGGLQRGNSLRSTREPVDHPSFSSFPVPEVPARDRDSVASRRQRVADELRYSDPDAVDEWRHMGAQETQLMASRDGPPRPRPANVSVPAPLSPPNRSVELGSSHRRSQSISVASGRGSTPGQIHRRATSSSESSAAPGITIVPPSQSPSDTPGFTAYRSSGLLSPSNTERPLPHVPSNNLVPTAPNTPRAASPVLPSGPPLGFVSQSSVPLARPPSGFAPRLPSRSSTPQVHVYSAYGVGDAEAERPVIPFPLSSGQNPAPIGSQFAVPSQAPSVPSLRSRASSVRSTGPAHPINLDTPPDGSAARSFAPSRQGSVMSTTGNPFTARGPALPQEAPTAPSVRSRASSMRSSAPVRPPPAVYSAAATHAPGSPYAHSINLDTPPDGAPARSFAPSRPESVRSSTPRRRESLNAGMTPAAGSAVLPDDGRLRRVPSNASLQSHGSYARFDSSTYLDPAFYPTAETQANTRVNAVRGTPRTSRAESPALSYISDNRA